MSDHGELGPETLLDRAAASEYITSKGYRQSVATLARKAVTGEGPRFARRGRFPVYRVADLDAWIASNISETVSSTKELEGLTYKPGARGKQ